MNYCRCCTCPPMPMPPGWTDIGTMRFRTYSARDALPVANVNINITAVVNNVAVYSTNVTTDENGVYGPIELPCPPRALSLDENNTTQQPYAAYNITATNADYDDHIVQGSQVFGGQETLEDMAMLPQEETNGADTVRSQPDVVMVPAQALFVGGNSTGPAPVDGRVLGQVIIPEKVVVHLGRPSAVATNVTVSFRDYIKNVASSEVYPTWPEQALRANIHAQISLALNRVYTEWYPSRGYVFNITNSTSFDQYYVHGREIFDVMSKITDDIFNTYLRRTGTINPYYAEYCDGKTVSCNGMKQWGTVTQANAGKNALQILQYYYGSNIEIVRTNNIAAIPASYPGTPLSLGSTGIGVRFIQRWLNRIAKDYPSFGTLTVNGVFDAATQSSVTKFQRQFSLTADGVVGRATWYKISYIYVSVTKLAQLTSEGEKPTGELVAGQYPGTPVRLGSSGDNVTQVQFWLNTAGEFDATIPAITVDGIFGAATQNAVKAFQTSNGLTADGIVGSATWAKLYQTFTDIENDVADGVGTFPGTTLQTDSTGDDVRRVQFFLRIVARSNSAVPMVNVDGVYGTATANAVTKYQSAYGLTPDGKVGKITWNSLYEVYTALINGLLSASQRPGTYPSTPLAAGSTGQHVKEMQYYLYILSAYYSSIPQISYDGIFGPATTAAVKAFQQLFGLTVDGIVGPATWAALYGQFTKLRNVDGLVYALRAFAYPGTPLTISSTGNNVLFVQFMLAYIGSFFDQILPVTAFDGIFDEALAEIVKSFQTEFFLTATGVVDEETWSAMSITYLSLAAGTGEPTENGEYPGFVLVLGSTGAAVRQLQGYINGIAARYSTSFFLPQTGIFDTALLQAVKDFQTDFGLPVTGAVDKATWDIIYNFYISEA